MPELALQQSQTNKSQVIRAAENEHGKITPASAQNPIMVHQRAYGNQAVQRMLQAKRLQAKVVINPPDDEYEREADQVADAVMRMPEPAVQRPAFKLEKDEEEKRRIQTKPLAIQTIPNTQRDMEIEDEEERIQTNLLIVNSISPMQRKESDKEDEEEKLLQTKPLQRQSVYVQREAEDKKCKKCPKNEERGLIQSKTISNKVGAICKANLITNLGQGQPLDPSTTAFFETRLGHDFSHVRLHTGPQAEEAARSISAKAYTSGEKIAFGSGRYSPDSQEGRWLLAHELIHVIQQGGAYFKNVRRKPLAHEMIHIGQGILQNNLIQRDDDDEHGEEPRSLKETLFPRNMKRSEILYEISVIDQWLNKSGPDESDAERAHLTAARESLEKELATTGGRCDPPEGKGSQPDAVSDELIDRLMGKYAKVDKDPGEGCSPIPYIAGIEETVCTIGYGHQIPGCPIVDKKNNKVLTLDEKKEVGISNLKCMCEGVRFDCKGPQGRNQLVSDAAGMANHVKSIVNVDLTQEEFDALVDISLHVGHLPGNLVEAINWYWCTPVGKNYVRSLYLNTALTRKGSSKIEENFVNRRKLRVWPESDTSPKCRAEEPDSLACGRLRYILSHPEESP